MPTRLLSMRTRLCNSMDANIKNDFPLFENNPGLVYLDSAATAQTPSFVLDRVREFETHSRANVHRGIYNLSERATKAYEDARAGVARFVGAESPEEIIFTKNTTESINLVAHSLLRTVLKKGDHILISRAEHHSNFLPWSMLRDTQGIILDIVDPEEDGALSLDLVAAALRPKTKLVALPHVSHVLGSVYPIEELGALFRRKGILFLVDGAQAIAHMPVDVKKLNCDFYAFSGHKMGGPMGIGVLYIRKEIGAALEPFMRGGGMIEEVREDRSRWAPAPHRFEAGTPNTAGAVGLAAACEYIERIGYNKIRSLERELMEQVTESFLSAPRVRIYGPQ